MEAIRSKLYVGCSLTQAPEAFKDEVKQFKDGLRGQYDVFDFVGLTGGTAADVYNWDIGHCVRDCDAFIAICDYPSIGLGWELGEATNHNKPILAVAHERSTVTRLVLGAAAVEPNVRFERYIDLADIVPFVNDLTQQQSHLMQ